MQIRVEVPDELALRLSPLQDQLPQILELGLREWNADAQAGFSGLAEVLEFLANLPSPEEILALKPSEALQQKIEDLLKKNRTVGLTIEEERLWQQYEYVEHLVRVAKAKALLKLRTL
ncbi:MAG: restriction endonuclease subunit S [Symploca sp. SIO2E6]|nr:restriction endonuclease subunit S [Symploca sp. SIO2E6]